MQDTSRAGVMRQIEQKILENRPQGMDSAQYLESQGKALFQNLQGMLRSDEAITGTQSYAKAFRDLEDNALISIWRRLSESLPLPDLKRADDMRAWIDDSANDPILQGVAELKWWLLNLKVVPPRILKFRQLKVLELSHSKLKFVPSWIGALTNLVELDLCCNRLISLPDAIGCLSQLQILLLTNNKLTSLPDSVGKLTKLKGLYLGRNNLKIFPEVIGRCHALERLCLGDNRLTHLSQSIAQLSRLQEISLHHNQIEDISIIGSCIPRLGEK